MAVARTPARRPSCFSPSRCAYEVFLSFRGGDTRKSFTDHLNTALVQAGIQTFRDEDAIGRGENIEAEVQRAIGASRMALVVFSKDYASSPWCLDELVMIMDRSPLGLAVIPVFYGVGPSEVSKQTGGYGRAFAGHKQRVEVERVQRWRAALRGIADLAGMVLQDRHEAQFIKDIVKEVANKLDREVFHLSPYLVGIDSRVAKINLWLQDESCNVKTLIICGIGGTGKTTIAKIVYNLNYRDFQGSSFLADITRKTSEQPTSGLISLQRQLLSDICKVLLTDIHNEDDGIMKIKLAVCCKKVLIVLDDVDDEEQLKAVVEMRKWLSPGSKMIITTRNKGLLNAQEDCSTAEVEFLDADQSLQLFSLHAFGQTHPPADYAEQTKRAANYCHGLPLAIQVLGSSLRGKPVDVWESALQEMREIPHPTIQKILRLSYDSLPHDDRRDLFLDIACFFVGMDKDYVATIADGCRYYWKVGIQDLINKCLVMIDEKNRLMMHELIRDMAKRIVHDESPKYPGNRSRVWDQNDAFSVLDQSRGTESIRGFSLNLPMLEQDRIGKQELNWKKHHARRRFGFFFWKPKCDPQPNLFPEENLSTEAFSKMANLQLLHLNYVNFNGDYNHFPKSLAWLYWHGYPLDCLPSNISLNNLVVLDIRNSQLKHLWEENQPCQCLPKLKILDLSHSHLLVHTPDFSKLPCLQRLILEDCINLIEIDASLGCLQNLILLNLKDCRSLKRLPRTVAKLELLEELVLSGCLSLGVSPKLLDALKSRVVGAKGTANGQVGSAYADSSDRLSLLQTTSSYSLLGSRLPPLKSPESCFSSIFLPHSLIYLSLANCNLSDDHIPKDLSFPPALQHLNLGSNPICTVPDSIHALKLRTLRLDHCRRLQYLPELPTSLQILDLGCCKSLERIAGLPSFFDLMGFSRHHCQSLVEIGGLFKLQPVRQIDIEMINKLCLINLESFAIAQVEMANSLTRTSRKMSPQVLHECGIFTFFLSGSKIPDWYTRVEKSSYRIDVNPDQLRKIIGLNFCAVYSHYESRNTDQNNFHFPEVHIVNKTKSLDFTYRPTFHETTSALEDKRWFSHMSFGNQMEAGDEVSVSVISYGYLVKEFGIYIVYDQEVENGQSITASPWYRSLTAADLSPHQIQPGQFYIRHDLLFYLKINFGFP